MIVSADAGTRCQMEPPLLLTDKAPRQQESLAVAVPSAASLHNNRTRRITGAGVNRQLLAGAVTVGGSCIQRRLTVRVTGRLRRGPMGSAAL